ncbi:selenocysteine-specific translation elongation factor [SAR202 cluster bacterium AD-804-J14_MRT_500m]|nr:selenocysteine-specific translation elongation factor [SAR202 cluster bacterium AD-804-J14_MRT_500m]
MHVIGTAGHVDHGKSTLIKALTGIDPDRLPEEKERGMTIDLGFAWITLPSGRDVGVVDVPGHERFVRNMLAGVGGIDLALLVIAADEGVMPQTREHLAILDLLKTKRTIVALTKTDLVDDEFLDLVQAETEEILSGTIFDGAPMIAISSQTGAGLDALKLQIDQLLKETPARQDLGRPRLAVDRTFTVAGFGTVVTGTLIDGTLSIGQEVELLPSGRRCRIRGLQSHREKIDVADPGRRLAVNLSGVSHDDVNRGDVLTKPGWLRPTNLINARVKLIPNAPRPLKHNARVGFHVLVSETPARIRLLDTRQLEPGDEAWAQIHLAYPVPLVKDDFFVIRDTETTLGGGKVVDTSATRQRPFVSSVIDRLEAMEHGNLEQMILGAIDQWGPCTIAVLAERRNQTYSQIEPVVQQLVMKGDVILLGNFEAVAPNLIIYSLTEWNLLKRSTKDSLTQYHSLFPLRKGISREELRNRMGLTTTLCNLVLGRMVSEATVSEDGTYVRLPTHSPTPTSQQQKLMSQYLASLEIEPYSPPTDNALPPDLLGYLSDGGRVVKVDNTLVFTTTAYQEMVAAVTEYIETNGNITVGDARTLFNSSRKYILPLLEYLDQQRVTKRVGDERVLR